MGSAQLATQLANQPATLLADQLNGRVILITGAGDGIGAAAAETFATAGATVILAGRTTKKLELMYDRIIKAGNPEPAIYPIDHLRSGPKEYAEMAGIIQENFGRLDGIILAAAVPGESTPYEYYNPENWLQVIHTNLTTPFALTQALYPLLLETGKTHGTARLIYCTDESVASGQAFRPAFAASKAGLQSLMAGFADETEHHHCLQVLGFDPGAINTATRRKMYPGNDNENLPKPAECADALLRLFLNEKAKTGSITLFEAER